MGRVDRSEQGDPAPSVQRAIEDDERDGGDERRGVRAAQGVENRAEIRLPEDCCRQEDRNRRADEAPAGGPGTPGTGDLHTI
jgi:hypothetical protein